MSKKKLILIPALLMALTACGPTSNPTSNPTTDPTSAPTSEPTTAPSVSDPTTSAPVEVVATKIEITNKEELTAEWFVGNGDRNVNYLISYSDGTTKARGATVSSSNPDVISCPGGIKIHAQGAGTATVTVTVDSLSDSVEITVQAKAEIVAPTIAEILAGKKGDKTNARGELLQISYGGYFIGDDTGIIYVYNAPDPSWKIGDTIAMAEAQIDEYGGIKQLKSGGENFYQEADIEDSINLDVNYAAKTGAEISALTAAEKGKIIPVSITASILWSEGFKFFWTMAGFDDVTILYSGYLNDADKENDLSDGARYEMTGFIAGSGSHNNYTNRLNFYPTSMKQVESITVESVSLSVDKDKIEVGKTAKLSPAFLPDGASASVTYKIVSGEDIIKVEDDGKVTGVKEGTATVKAICGTLESNTVTITVVEPKVDIPVYTIKNPVAGETYYLSLVQKNVDNTRFYFTGVEDGYNLGSTDKHEDASGIVLEEVTGGYNIKTESGKYINAVYDGTKYVNPKIQDEATTVWTWDTTYNTLVTEIAGNGKTYYIGAYNDKTAFSMSDISFAATSFVSQLITFEEPETPVNPDTPTSGTIKLTVDSLGLASSSYSAGTKTVDGTDFEFIQLGNYGDGIQMRDKDGKTSELWNTTAIGGIEKIELTYSSSKDTYDNPDAVIFSFGNSTATDSYTTKLSTVKGTKTYTITPDVGTYKYFNLEHDYGYSMYWDSIVIYWGTGATLPEEPTPDTPDTPDTPVVPDSNAVTLTVDSLGLPSSSYSANTKTVNGVDFEFIQLGNYGDGIQMRDKDGKTSELWNTTAIDGIEKIELTYSSSKDTYDNPDAVIFSFGNSTATDSYTTKLSTVKGTKTYTITPDANTYTYFHLEHDYGYSMYWASIVIYF